MNFNWPNLFLSAQAHHTREIDDAPANPWIWLFLLLLVIVVAAIYYTAKFLKKS